MTFLTGSKTGQPKKVVAGFDLDTLQGLQELARLRGYEEEAEKAEKEKKLSFLQRLSRGLTALEPINAVYEKVYEGKPFVTTYLKDIFQEAGSALTGKELRTDRKKTFKDVLLKQGMKDREGKLDLVDVAGFIGDVFTDPTTYFGGAIVKGLGKGVKGAGKATGKIATKIAPSQAARVTNTFNAGRDALGRAFVYGYGTSKIGRKLGVDVPENLERFVNMAVELGDARKFKSLIKESGEDLGMKSDEFLKKYTDTKPFADNVTRYMNKVNDLKVETGEKYAEMFKKLPKKNQEDLFEGLYNTRKKFGIDRDKLMKSRLASVANELGLDVNRYLDDSYISLKLRNPDLVKSFKQIRSNTFKEVNDEMITKFNELTPPDIFKDLETIKFFNKTLKPELNKLSSQYVERAAIKKTGEKVAKELVDDGMAGEMMMKYYYPFLKNDTIKGFSNAIRMSNEDYLKAFRGILNKDEIIKDVPTAYATRAAQLAKDGITKETLEDFVTVYGKPVAAFADKDEALNAGYKMIKSKGQFGDEIGYLKEQDYKMIQDMFDPGFKAIDDIARATGFDWLTTLFKKSVTGLFAPFHVRNFVSGQLQNYQVLGSRALNPVTISRGQKFATDLLSKKPVKGTIKLGGKEFDKADLVKAYREHYGLSSQYLSDYGIEEIEKLQKAMKRTAKVGRQQVPLGIFETPRWIGNYIETQQKATAFLTALKKGYEVPEALKLAEKAGFDYSRLTPFEKHVMRRLIPFYSFSAKNARLQLETLVKNPERLGTLLKGGRAAGTPQGTDTKEMKMPDWMRNRFVARFGESEYGLPQVISGFGTPIEENAELMEKGVMGVLSRMNTLLKVPIERAAGRDFFRERDLKDVYTAQEYSFAPEVIKNFLKIREVKKPIYKAGEPTGKFKTSYVADPNRLHIARNLFTSRGFSYLNTLFGEEELSDKGKMIKSLTGLKPYEIDEQAVKYFEDRDNYRDFLDILKRLGIVKEFEKAYIPKDQK